MDKNGPQMNTGPVMGLVSLCIKVRKERKGNPRGTALRALEKVQQTKKDRLMQEFWYGNS